MKNSLKIKTVSSLAKVLPEKIYSSTVTKSLKCVQGQSVSYQIAYKFIGNNGYLNAYTVNLKSELSENIRLYRVEPVSAILTSYHNERDEDYISHKPGLYPDVLRPLENGRVKGAHDVWQAIWVEISVPENTKPGIYPIEITFFSDDEDMDVVAKSIFHLEIRTATLPKNDLYVTQWFHNDCIADIHGVKIFSEQHFKLIDQYMKLAHEGGINMILTPVLTPPLDTRIGCERPTVQLVEITKAGDMYEFSFDNFDKYVRLAIKNGIKNFEVNHMFTQGGAKATPKVIATVNGRKKRIFGWNTSPLSTEYTTFIKMLIPAVIQRFEYLGVTKDQLFFHTSDEPTEEHIERYASCSSLILPLIKGCHQFDALSNYSFYETGAVEIPVVATHHIKPFIEKDVDNLWCYYCCSGGRNVSNRFIAMPSYRNRILGVQMYKFGIKGFLHWGYNYYYSRLSDRVINPYSITDAESSFPSGDSFSVYPAENGPIPSLRFKVFKEALDDISLLKLVEKKIGKDNVIAELDRIAGMNIGFTNYPKGEKFFFDLYDFIFTYID